MSEKEYEIEITGDTIKVREKEPYRSYPPSGDPTMREKMGEKVRGASQKTKIFFTIFFNIYGALYRMGSNSALSFLIGMLQMGLSLLYGFCFVFLILYQESFISELGEYKHILLTLIPWIIDFICIILTNDIRLFGMKKYKNYQPKFK